MCQVSRKKRLARRSIFEFGRPGAGVLAAHDAQSAELFFPTSARTRIARDHYFRTKVPGGWGKKRLEPKVSGFSPLNSSLHSLVPRRPGFRCSAKPTPVVRFNPVSNPGSSPQKTPLATRQTGVGVHRLFPRAPVPGLGRGRARVLDEQADFMRNRWPRRAGTRPRSCSSKTTDGAKRMPAPKAIAWTRAIKDVFPLPKKPCVGSASNAKAGWDTHGLPSEVESRARNSVSTGKEEIEAYGVEPFNPKKCQNKRCSITCASGKP